LTSIKTPVKLKLVITKPAITSAAKVAQRGQRAFMLKKKKTKKKTKKKNNKIKKTKKKKNQNKNNKKNKKKNKKYMKNKNKKNKNKNKKTALRDKKTDRVLLCEHVKTMTSPEIIIIMVII